MGCASSKQSESVTTVAIYRPPPSSFAVFDINTIKEPWLMLEDDSKPPDGEDEKIDNKNATQNSVQALEKLNKLELVSTGPPKSWEEISRALDDLKPTLNSSDNNIPATSSKGDNGAVNSSAQDSGFPLKKVKRRSFSFHTLDELDKKKSNDLKKSESLKSGDFKWPELKKSDPNSSTRNEAGKNGATNRLRGNVFLERDRLEREREGKQAKFDELMKNRRDPLSQFSSICPPDGANSVVLYTTSLGGVRRTYEDCNKVRSILDGHRVIYDERDVALHGEFLAELKKLLLGDENDFSSGGGGSGVRSWSVPRLFVKGRYIGGVEEVVEINELGRLGRILSYVGVERGVGRQACEGCGGARFVPCVGCGGSCKVAVAEGKGKERCPKCNENGLVHCPICAQAP